jgi:hypothetical protein
MVVIFSNSASVSHRLSKSKSSENLVLPYHILNAVHHIKQSFLDSGQEKI